MIDTLSKNDFETIADAIFPEVTQAPEDIMSQYPPRQLSNGAWVSRFAPSPTGFIHIGGILTALINRMICKENDGIYILRIEDTDQKREIQNGIEQIVDALKQVDLLPDEGPYETNPVKEKGKYGPYIQSQRLNIYHIFLKDIIARGLAYPCFMSSEEIADIRQQQEKSQLRIGIYGPWARSRMLVLDEILQRIHNKEDYVIRIKSPYPSEKVLHIDDIIRGRLDLPENDVDSILLKSDRYPTYHFAHIVDDYTMRVNLVLRGDEWISSIPLHVQLNQAIKNPSPAYAHIAPIATLDGKSRRKLSKRKDAEAAMAYYYQKGYPTEAILEYLLNLANSNFEDWRREHPNKPYSEFQFKMSHLGASSALFDTNKFNDISKDVIAKYSGDSVYEFVVKWAQIYAPHLVPLLATDSEYSRKVFSLGRGGPNPRKEFVKWEDFEIYYGFFFDSLYESSVPAGYVNMPKVSSDATVKALNFFIQTTPSIFTNIKDEWLTIMREFAVENSFSVDRQAYLKTPDAYKGSFGDLMMILRVALTGKSFTPDLYDIMQIMGEERVVKRLQKARAHVLHE